MSLALILNENFERRTTIVPVFLGKILLNPVNVILQL